LAEVALVQGDRKKIRIGIEAFALSEEKLSGIGNVVFNCLKELQNKDCSNEYTVFFMSDQKHLNFSKKNWTSHRPGFLGFIKGKYITCSNEIDLMKQTSESVIHDLILFYKKIIRAALGIFHWLAAIYCMLSFPFILRKHKIDIYLGTSAYFFPFFFASKIKKISIVYDIVWKLFPETMNFQGKAVMKFLAKWNLKRADLLIAISESTLSDVKNILQINTNIMSVPLAADSHVFFKAGKNMITSIMKKYDIRKKYILSVSTLEPRKNLKSLICALSETDLKDKYQLVLVGDIGWIQKDFFSLIKQKNLDVLITGYVPKEDLAPLYSGAELFVYPTLYEGFGLPVLESMQCGCPVISSNNSSIPEVAGDAAILVQADDIKKLSSTICNVLENNRLRISLSRKGLERSKQFSWEKYAEQMINIFLSI